MTKYIFRGNNSGVFYGEMIERKGQEVKIGNCRRIWYWDGACSLSDLATIGTKKPENCKFTIAVNELVITDCIEFIKCTDEACRVIEGVKSWTIS